MQQVDMTLVELRNYLPKLTKKDDFDDFWKETLEESNSIPLNSELIPVHYPIPNLSAFDLNYDGFKGTRINGYYILPEKKTAEEKLPVIVYYHGYTRNKGFIQDYFKWLIQGYAVLAISIRGQGGTTNDAAAYSQGGIAGWMTNGLLDPYEYYYRNVYVDSIRAIDFLWEREEIDKGRIGIYGLSQGGGITLAVAGLDHRVKLAMPIYPYLCEFEKGIEKYLDGPYSEFHEYFRYYDPEMKTKDTVYDTLSYFDAMNFAPLIECPVLLAVGLIDTVCPPSTIFAAYNHILAEKTIKIYPHHGHEPLPFHDEAMIEFARRL